MGSFQEDSRQEADEGNSNPAYEENEGSQQESASEEYSDSTKARDGYTDLVSSIVPSLSKESGDKTSTISLPLYEISLNGNSMKREAGDKPTEFPNLGSHGDRLNGDDEESDQDMRCGLGFFSPEWIQKFATKKMFLVVFSLLGVIQSMTWSYFTATITTLEKRFKISSQTAGIVMTGNEISQILFSVVIAYFGGKGHRPRWIAVGVLFSAISCFVLASPQAFYGSGDDMLALTEEYAHLYESSSYNQGLSQTTPRSSLDFPTSSTENDIMSVSTSSTSSPFTKNSIFPSPKRGRVSVCQPNALGGGPYSGSQRGGACADSSAELSTFSSFAPLIIIFLSQFVAGIGNLLFFSLGGPYLDDNSSRANMPRVLGCTMSLRLVGPTIGFLLASRTLKMFVNPTLTPIITPDDPRWQGAWWLGWVIFGSVMMIMSVFMALFPRRLRRNNAQGKSIDPDKINSPEGIPKLTDIPVAVKSLIRNKVNLCNNLAGVCYLFSVIGYWTYMPKYLETIFMQTASNASIISGVVGILFQSTGMMLSGILISKFQPSARKLAFWNVVVAFTSVAVMASFTQLGCNVGNIAFGNQNPSDGTWNLTTECNADCNCKTSKILPVCYKETNTVYYSACHAGCTLYENNTLSNCKCVGAGDATLTLGNCSEGCTGIFILFLSISALIKFFDATGRIGNMLISYRCVELKDRSLSIGLNIFLISLFAFLPSPIVFGRIIDNVCLVWGNSTCGGKRGNCMLYDGEQLRYVFNLTAAAFTLIGGALDCLVLYYVKDMELYTEPDVELEKQKQLNSQEDICDSKTVAVTTSFSSNNNKENSPGGWGGTGAAEVGGGGGFVNLCFNNEKSEK